jgi:hypothetical protein
MFLFKKIGNLKIDFVFMTWLLYIDKGIRESMFVYSETWYPSQILSFPKTYPWLRFQLSFCYINVQAPPQIKSANHDIAEKLYFPLLCH